MLVDESMRRGSAMLLSNDLLIVVKQHSFLIKIMDKKDKMGDAD